MRPEGVSFLTADARTPPEQEKGGAPRTLYAITGGNDRKGSASATHRSARRFLLTPPALGECSHRGLATLSIAVCRRPVLMMPEGQCPHPRRSYRGGVGLEDASNNSAIRRHVKIVGTPVPGRARGRGAFENEVH